MIIIIIIIIVTIMILCIIINSNNNDDKKKKKNLEMLIVRRSQIRGVLSITRMIMIMILLTTIMVITIMIIIIIIMIKPRDAHPVAASDRRRSRAAHPYISNCHLKQAMPNKNSDHAAESSLICL